MSSDLTFITNEAGKDLLQRFQVLIRDTRFFDVLVGYFYTSGFYKLHHELAKTEKIRILIGISTNRQTYDQIQTAKQLELQFSHAEVKTAFADQVAAEMESSEDHQDTALGVQRFVEWIRSGKLQIRAYPAENLHAKLYIMTFAEGDRDAGRVITGSSNFTAAGLVDNLELNVELKNRSDYDFAMRKFNELWADAVEVSQKYLETIQTRTWLNDTITPYELYLKFLYEYFKEKINLDAVTLETDDLPENFREYEYQAEAVRDAKSKLDEYGGVFIADVVGLGKTFITALLAKQLDGRCLVLASPILLSKDNPGSWENVLRDFHVRFDTESIGKLDDVLRRGTDKYKNIIIDEAHRFRSEDTGSYEQLAEICRGKRVILVSATPYNNRPADILALLKLFQNARKSTIPNLSDLERFFKRLEKRVKGLDRQKDHDAYLEAVRENAREIREKVLKYLMIRRTRKEIEDYFAADLAKQGLKFPTVADPQALYYQLNEQEDAVFTHTLEVLTRRLAYARYTPLQYYTGKVAEAEKLAQRNISSMIKTLLLKRMESSFHAFRHSLQRCIASYELFIAEFDRGKVFVSKKHTQKIFDYLAEGDAAGIQKLLDEEKAEQYAAADFDPQFRVALAGDLLLLQELAAAWREVKRDPKLLAFAGALRDDAVLRQNKLIVFTESRETAEYLAQQLAGKTTGGIVVLTGMSSPAQREAVIANFDANARQPKDEFRIVITTEVLAEGVNLHRANAVINYDLPWNPTRIMQRVGRVNRVDTKFATIHTYNFFPTRQANDELKLREAAEMKINAFIAMLGNDARLLTDDEDVVSQGLFARLNARQTVTGEEEADDTELKYLAVIRDLRDHDPALFARIKRLPKKARSARAAAAAGLLTYFRKDKIQKFFLAGADGPQEADFFTAARLLEADASTPRGAIGDDYFALLAGNKEAFAQAVAEEEPEPVRGSRDSATQLLRILKSAEMQNCDRLTDDDEQYIRQVMTLLQQGALPLRTAKKILALVQAELKKGINPLAILAILRTNISPNFFTATMAEGAGAPSGPREVVLSEYLGGA